MENVLLSAKMPFKIDTPYKLIESGEAGEKPLIVYLHGFNQNIAGFQKRVANLLDLEAYHLFIQGPYPVYSRKNREKKVEEWGRSWYWYDGGQDQFVKSLELASQFVEQVINNVLNHVSISRICLVGYSMGGYLAGYFALSRQQVNELVVIGGRIKTEVFEGKEKKYSRLNVLALHGSKDKRVKSSPQSESCQQLSQWGANVTFKEAEAKHALSSLFITETKKWLVLQGYG